MPPPLRRARILTLSFVVWGLPAFDIAKTSPADTFTDLRRSALTITRRAARGPASVAK